MKKKLVVLTGPGMSKESGIDTFRGSGGLWGKYPVEQVATPEGFQRDPELVINFYNERRHELDQVKPNEGHYLLAQMEQDFDISIITQNVDNLHERAGSSHVVHLHGVLTKGCSSLDPNDPRFIEDLKPGVDMKLGDKAGDGSQLRPYIVWFGEAVPEIETAVPLVREADIFVIIGTSMNVYPAAGLMNFLSPGVPAYLIDPMQVNIPDMRGITHIQKGASKGVEELWRIIK